MSYLEVKGKEWLAAAIANNPDVVLADEPTGDLDTETGQIIVKYLHMVNKEMGKTVLMVTHDSSIARQCDRIYRIQDGRIRSVQSPTADEDTSAVSRIDIVRERLKEINMEIENADRAVVEGRIPPSDFAQRRMELARRKDMFEEELHRLGL